MNISVASWNIAGGHTVASNAQHDYNPEELGYFIGVLGELAPDVICLQEVHTSPDGKDSNAQEIAGALGMHHVFNSPASVSHVDAAYRLGTAIISRLSCRDTKTIIYPKPGAELFWKDGRPAETHDKHLQSANLGAFSVFNTQVLPLNVFGYPYDGSDVGRELARGINAVIEENIQAPAIFCGDFNFGDPFALYPHLLTLGFTDAIRDFETMRPKNGAKRSPDHLLYSPEFRLLKADVRETNADHHVCMADFEFNG